MVKKVTHVNAEVSFFFIVISPFVHIITVKKNYTNNYLGTHILFTLFDAFNSTIVSDYELKANC